MIIFTIALIITGSWYLLEILNMVRNDGKHKPRKGVKSNYQRKEGETFGEAIARIKAEELQRKQNRGGNQNG